MKFVYLSICLILTFSMQAQLTNDETIDGLKETLTLACNISVKSASKKDGFNGNQMIRIPFPPEAQKMESSLRQMGMGNKVDEFIVSMNRAAEHASKEAAVIFIDAIKEMDIQDGKAILTGGNSAATNYMVDHTAVKLYMKFKPIVSASLKTVEVNKYWDPLASAYNKIPLVEDVNPDLEDYATQKSIEGLFKLMAREEKNIRTLGSAQVTESLKKLFGTK
ncbi:MAG TPA: DUF4197 domain-containing protein [Flavobacteriales bacterium]|nr:DUF4197 domain-containing protein [Flavobacteriales bacterium]